MLVAQRTCAKLLSDANWHVWVHKAQPRALCQPGCIVEVQAAGHAHYSCGIWQVDWKLGSPCALYTRCRS